MRALTPRAASLWAAIVVLATCGVAHAIPEIERGIGLPRDASREGWRIDWLVHFANIAIGALFVMMVVWLVAACLRHGAKKHAPENYRGGDRRGVMLTLGVASSIFFFVDGTLFFNSTEDLHEVFWNYAKIDHNPHTVKIEVNAHQWAWDFRYAGQDGRFNTQDDVVRLNDLRVPVNTPVSLQLASTDVLHAFYVPNMRAKIDVVPGTINHLWFEPSRRGEFDIGCAQHCGVNHYKMKARLTVLSKRDYEWWAREAGTLASRAFDADDRTAHWGWSWRER